VSAARRPVALLAASVLVALAIFQAGRWSASAAREARADRSVAEPAGARAASRPFQVSFGGNGNDTLFAFNSTHLAAALYGEAGTDCIEDAAAADIIDCGDGIDYVSTASGQSTRINPNCENRIAAACP